MKLVKSFILYFCFGAVLALIIGLSWDISLNFQSPTHGIPQKLLDAFTRQPEGFTELYFQNNEHLPTKPKNILNYGAVPYTFSFTVHNMELSDTSYTYKVTILGEKNGLIDQKKILVKKNASKSISEVFVLPNLITTPTQVTVTLLEKNQSISFWIGGHK